MREKGRRREHPDKSKLEDPNRLLDVTELWKAHFPRANRDSFAGPGMMRLSEYFIKRTFQPGGLYSPCQDLLRNYLEEQGYDWAAALDKAKYYALLMAGAEGGGELPLFEQVGEEEKPRPLLLPDRDGDFILVPLLTSGDVMAFDQKKII